MKSDLTLALPCRADEPGLSATLESLFAACQHPQLPPQLIGEFVICINGLRPGETCPPLLAVHDFCDRHGVQVEETWLADGSDSLSEEGKDEKLLAPQIQRGGVSTKSFSPSFLVLLTERQGKPPAWNALWRRARGKMILFCDADVRVESNAVYHLYTRLQTEPQLRLVAAREVPVLQGEGTWWSRMGAIAYRFNFGNAGGRLYLICKDALSEAMPEDLLLEDAWLTVVVGKPRVAKEVRAHVLFLPPATWRDCFAERVRTEGGKLQLAQAHRRSEERRVGKECRSRWSPYH